MISLKQTLKAITSKFSALNTLLNDVPHYTLLWTNPNPTSSFSAQTISLDLSKYDMVEISAFYSVTEDVNKMLTTSIIPTNSLGSVSSQKGNGTAFANRKVTLSSQSIAFTACTQHYDTTSRDNMNTCCVPYKIYGIKFGGGYKALRSLFAKEVAVC